MVQANYVLVANKHFQIHLLSTSTKDLEHAELLTDVGETLGLLGLVLNDVESHGLGEGSTH